LLLALTSRLRLWFDRCPYEVLFAVGRFTYDFGCPYIDLFRISPEIPRIVFHICALRLRRSHERVLEGSVWVSIQGILILKHVLHMVILLLTLLLISIILVHLVMLRSTLIVHGHRMSGLVLSWSINNWIHTLWVAIIEKFNTISFNMQNFLPIDMMVMA